MVDVVCIGNVCADIVGKHIDRLPDKGKLKTIESINFFVGGCGANVSVDLAKIGVNVALNSKVGDDQFGEAIINYIEESGVITSPLKRDTEKGTSISLVMVSSDGERSFLYSPAATNNFTEEDVDYKLISKSRILLVAGTFIMDQIDGEPMARVLKKAKEMGVYTVLDVVWDPKGEWLQKIECCLSYLDLFIPSEDEAREMSREDDPDKMADFFLQRGCKTVVIKLGAKGCLIKTMSERFFIEAFKTNNVVDTNGAGDSFVAGFITGILNGWDLEKIGTFANAVGYFCVQALGASNGIKSKEEILEFINSQKKGE